MKRGSLEVFRGKVEEQLDLWGISLTAGQMEALESYVRLLSGYERANVVGTREVERLWSEHVLDALSCLLCGSVRRAAELVDVGSGGGLPGIPLHVAMGFRRLCLLESTAKKAEFLSYALREMGVEGWEVENTRAEELGRDGGYRGKFGAATARAVAPLAVISEYCLPLVREGDVFVAMKGRLEEQEYSEGLEAMKALGGELEEVISVRASPRNEQKERRLVVVRKVRATPGKYPRAVGVPGKNPLGS